MANAPANQTAKDETQPTEETETTDNRVWDVDYDPDAVSEYECLDCGELVLAASHPGSCPQCGSTPRNRSMPFE